MGRAIKFLTSVILLMSLGMASHAQGLRPRWVNEGSHELTLSYIEPVSGEGKTVGEARDKAANAIVQRRNLAAGARMTVRVENGNIVTSGSEGLVVKAHIRDEWVEELPYGGYRVHLLVQTLKNPSYSAEPVTVTGEYPMSARAFVPGMEQLHKGQKAKGTLFIVGEVACVGGIIVAEEMRQDYNNRIGSTHNAQQRKKFVDKANTCATVRNVAIGAAAALYVWNVVDALTSTGARYVKLGGSSLAFTPYADLQTTGFAINLKF